MTYTVNSADDYSLNLAEGNNEESILQNIALLLNTKQGSVPMYRDFGLPMEFLDKPPDAAEAIAYSEITEALDTFVPEAKLEDISFTHSNGKMSISVEVSLDDDEDV